MITSEQVNLLRQYLGGGLQIILIELFRHDIGNIEGQVDRLLQNDLKEMKTQTRMYLKKTIMDLFWYFETEMKGKEKKLNVEFYYFFVMAHVPKMIRSFSNLENRHTDIYSELIRLNEEKIKIPLWYFCFVNLKSVSLDLIVKEKKYDLFWNELLNFAGKIKSSSELAESESKLKGLLEQIAAAQKEINEGPKREKRPADAKSNKGKKIPTSDLVNGFISYILLNDIVTQSGLAKYTGISQSTWSRAFNKDVRFLNVLDETVERLFVKHIDFKKQITDKSESIRRDISKNREVPFDKLNNLLSEEGAPLEEDVHHKLVLESKDRKVLIEAILEFLPIEQRKSAKFAMEKQNNKELKAMYKAYWESRRDC